MRPLWHLNLLRKSHAAVIGSFKWTQTALGELVARLTTQRGSFQMKDFSHASFAPDTIGIMKIALDAAVASLPEPLNSAHLKSMAETILRTAQEGERDPKVLQRMALIELQITLR